jgi:hypothetical protein
MIMYNLRDVVSGKFVLLSEFDLLKMEDVVSIKIFKKEGKDKVITINLEIFDYLFSSELKKELKRRIQNDLGNNIVVKFGIGF